MGKVKKSDKVSKHINLKSHNNKKGIRNKSNLNIKFKKDVNNKSSQKKLKKILTTDESTSDSIRKHDPAEIEQTLFVGNIPSNTKKSQLKSLFEPFGSVKSIRFRTLDGKKILKHKMRKETETLNAYVVMNSKETVENALKLSGTEFKGKHIRVTKAKKSSEDIDTKRIVFVGNLKYCATDEKLYEIFSSCGELDYVRTIRNTNGCKGIAYVCFKRPESVILALELNNTLLDERPMRVERYSTYKLETYQKKKTNEIQHNAISNRNNNKPTINEIQKKGKIKKIKNQLVNNSSKDFNELKSNKKSNYRGAQITKQKKHKKKKRTSVTQILAKKIAPKIAK